MKDKHPIIFIAEGAGIMMAVMAIYQFMVHAMRQPILWLFAIAFLLFALLLLAVSMLLHARRLAPSTSLLPPPSRF